MYDERVLGAEHVAHGLLLRGVEPGQAQSGRAVGSEAEWGGGVEEVAQFGQAALARLHGVAQRVEHHAVGIVVETQLHADEVQRLQPCEGRLAGEFHHHAVGLGVAYGAGKGEVGEPAVAFAAEEAHLFAILEVVFDVVVCGAQDFHHKTVERVVVAASHAHGIPAVAAFHLAVDAHQFRVALKRRLLGLILLLQQLVLFFEGEEGGHRGKKSQ